MPCSVYYDHATMKTLTWLHLSDLHCCNPQTGWDADGVLRALRADLEKLRDDHGLRPDLLLFTGDAAFGSAGDSKIAQQFEEAQLFFEELLALLDLPKERVFLVPGNHDVDRDEIDKAHTPYLGKLGREQVIELIRDKGKTWSGIMARLAAYRAFLQACGYDHLLEDADRLVFARRLEIHGVDVGIAGLNSAWSCEGEDRGKLWLGGEWQIKTAETALRGADVALGLIHHPLRWTREDPEDLETPLARVFDVLLHGHEHKPWVHPLHGGSVRIAAGACYDRRRAERPAAYNVVRLDFEARRGEVWLRQFHEDKAAWTKQPIPGDADDGIWLLTGLRCFGKEEPVVEAVPKPAPEVPAEAVSPPSLTGPESRGVYGREDDLRKLAKRVEKTPVTAVFGLKGVGKTTLIDELKHQTRAERRSLRIEARATDRLADLYEAAGNFLGAEGEPKPFGIMGMVKFEPLADWAKQATPCLLHVERADQWLVGGVWREKSMGDFFREVAQRIPQARVILEFPERPPANLLPERIYATQSVRGISLVGMTAFFARWALKPPALEEIFQRLGGSSGAHGLAMRLLATVAESLDRSPAEVLRAVPTMFGRQLDVQLFDKLYKEVLSAAERRLLDLCALYRVDIPEKHTDALLDRAQVAESTFGDLRRHCLLSAPESVYSLHSVIVERARAHRDAESDEVLDDHGAIATLWLAEFHRRRQRGVDEVRVAHEAFHHLVAAQDAVRLYELKDHLAEHGGIEQLDALQRKLYDAGKLGDVRQVLKLMVTVDASDHKAHRFLGETIARLEGWGSEEAAEHLEEAVRARPTFGPYAASWGRSLLTRREAARFAKHIESLSNHERQRVFQEEAAVAVYADALAALGRGEEAERLRQKRVAAGSSDPIFYNDLAKSRLRAGDAAGALEILESARRRQVADDFTESIRADVLDALGRGEEADRLRQERVAAGSSNPAFYADLAKSRLRADDAAGALEILDLARARGLDNEVTAKFRSKAEALLAASARPKQ